MGDTYDIGGMAAGGAINAGMGIVNNVAQLAFGRQFQKQALRGQKEALEQQNAAQMDMWHKTNYKPQVEELKKAGLNPGLLYGMSGGGSTTTGSGSASAPGGGSPQNIMDMGTIAQIELLKAQKENIEADTANKKAGAGKTTAETPGATARSTMDTQEAESRKGWTSVMSKTFGDEQEARQAIASTIGEMWQDGKLKEGAEADLKQKLLQNAKTEADKKAVELGMERMRVDIRTGHLNNEILELEKDMQTELGIDRGSPTWLKMIGRLFMKYFKK